MALEASMGLGGLSIDPRSPLAAFTYSQAALVGRPPQYDGRDNTAENYIPQMMQMPFAEGVYRSTVDLPPFEYLRKEGGHQLLLPSSLAFGKRLDSETIEVLKHNQALQERSLNPFGLPRRDYDPDVASRIQTLELKMLDEQKRRLETRKDRLAADVAEKNFETSTRQEEVLKAEIISLQAVIVQREAILESYKRERNITRSEVDLPTVDSSRAKIYRLEAERVYEEAYSKMKFNLENLKAHNAILWKTAQSLQQSLLQMSAEEPADLELMAAARAKILNEKIASIRDSTLTQQRKNLVNGGGELAELENIMHRLEEELRMLDHTKSLAVQRLDALSNRPLTAAEVRDASQIPKTGGQHAEVRRHLAEENRLLEHKLALLEKAQQEEARSREELVIKTKQECSVMFAKIAREVLTKLITES